MELSPTLLLLTIDEALAELVSEIVVEPWKLVRESAEQYMARMTPPQADVRVIILDDQTVEESERGRLLKQIGKQFFGASLLYVAGNHRIDNEKRARTNGAHYYAAKPLLLERFASVLRSFLQMHHIRG
jgi:response regulator of citrate/malate metabolism